MKHSDKKYTKKYINKIYNKKNIKKYTKKYINKIYNK